MVTKLEINVGTAANWICSFKSSWSKLYKVICSSWAEIQSAGAIQLQTCKINCNKDSKKTSLNCEAHTIMSPSTCSSRPKRMQGIKRRGNFTPTVLYVQAPVVRSPLLVKSAQKSSASPEPLWTNGSFRSTCLRHLSLGECCQIKTKFIGLTLYGVRQWASDEGAVLHGI